MFKGERVKGIEFYDLLFTNKTFTSELGKISLASGKLEAELILFFNHNNVSEKINGATLGRLIKVGKKNNLLDKNLVQALELVLKQRNYFMHNIYALFKEQIEVTLLERDNLIDTDVVTYTDYAWQLRVNLENLAEMLNQKSGSN